MFKHVKRQTAFILLLISFCCLFITGCSEKVENKDITITIGDMQKQGKYTGELENDLPNGQGKFETVNQENTSYTLEGIWKNGELQKGTTIFYTDKPSKYEVEQYNKNVPVKGKLFINNILYYEGDFNAGIPNGQGKQYSNNKIIYEGNFDNGYPALDTISLNTNTNFANWEYSVTHTETQTTIGNKQANGIFLIVYINAKNNANTQRQIGANNFFVLYDNKARIYGMDETAMFQANIIDNFQLPWYLTQIQPSLSAQNIKIIFDIPKDAKQIKLIPREGMGKANPILVTDEIK